MKKQVFMGAVALLMLVGCSKVGRSHIFIPAAEQSLLTEPGSYSENSHYFHNNWGWDGLDNGYYAKGIFDPCNDPDEPSNTRVDEEYKYQYNLDMWTNIYR